MKKINIFLCIATILFVFTGVQKSQADTKLVPNRSYVKKPDLTVSITINSTPFKNREGIQCYWVRPIFTITNIGQSTARNFECFIWHKYQSNTWMEGNGAGPYQSLAPGKTITIDNPILVLGWCVNEKDWSPAYRIKVDTKNTVNESNEKNNVAEKTFLSIHKTSTLQKQ